MIHAFNVLPHGLFRYVRIPRSQGFELRLVSYQQHSWCSSCDFECSPSIRVIEKLLDHLGEPGVPRRPCNHRVELAVEKAGLFGVRGRRQHLELLKLFFGDSLRGQAGSHRF